MVWLAEPDQYVGGLHQLLGASDANRLDTVVGVPDLQDRDGRPTAHVRRFDARRHRGSAKRYVRYVCGQVDSLGPGRDPRQQGPGVEERRLIRMVLKRDQTVAQLLALDRERDNGRR